jgi:hypothetical protein
VAPLGSLVRAALLAAVQYFFARTLLAEVAVRRRAGRVLRGLLFIGGGSVVGCLAFGFFLLALFFNLAHIGDWVWPALITGGLGLLASGLLVWEGARLVRRD